MDPLSTGHDLLFLFPPSCVQGDTIYTGTHVKYPTVVTKYALPDVCNCPFPATLKPSPSAAAPPLQNLAHVPPSFVARQHSPSCYCAQNELSLALELKALCNIAFAEVIFLNRSPVLAADAFGLNIDTFLKFIFTHSTENVLSTAASDWKHHAEFECLNKRYEAKELHRHIDVSEGGGGTVELAADGGYWWEQCCTAKSMLCGLNFDAERILQGGEVFDPHNPLLYNGFVADYVPRTPLETTNSTSSSSESPPPIDNRDIALLPYFSSRECGCSFPSLPPLPSASSERYRNGSFYPRTPSTASLLASASERVKQLRALWEEAKALEKKHDGSMLHAVFLCEQKEQARLKELKANNPAVFERGQAQKKKNKKEKAKQSAAVFEEDSCLRKLERVTHHTLKLNSFCTSRSLLALQHPFVSKHPLVDKLLLNQFLCLDQDDCTDDEADEGPDDNYWFEDDTNHRPLPSTEFPTPRQDRLYNTGTISSSTTPIDYLLSRQNKTYFSRPSNGFLYHRRNPRFREFAGGRWFSGMHPHENIILNATRNHNHPLFPFAHRGECYTPGRLLLRNGPKRLWYPDPIFNGPDDVHEYSRLWGSGSQIKMEPDRCAMNALGEVEEPENAYHYPNTVYSCALKCHLLARGFLHLLHDHVHSQCHCVTFAKLDDFRLDDFVTYKSSAKPVGA